MTGLVATTANLGYHKRPIRAPGGVGSCTAECCKALCGTASNRLTAKPGDLKELVLFIVFNYETLKENAKKTKIVGKWESQYSQCFLVVCLLAEDETHTDMMAIKCQLACNCECHLSLNHHRHRSRQKLVATQPKEHWRFIFDKGKSYSSH